MNYDEIIEEVGGCGLYQKLIVPFLYAVVILDGLQISSLIFIVPKVQKRCAIPGLPNDTYEVQDTNHADLIKTYIPKHLKDGITEYSNCYLYSNETIDGNRTRYKCNSWVYDKSLYQTSITSDLNLVCDRDIFTGHVKTVYFIGSFIIFFVGGWISDRFGRKIVIILCVLIQGISSLASGQVREIYLLLFLRCLSAIGGAGSFGAIIVFVTEITSIKHRARPAVSIQIAFSLSILITATIAYFIRYWRLLIIAISIPPFPLAFLIMWLVPESPRWLMTIKREKRAVNILRKIAKINKTNFIYQAGTEVELPGNKDRGVKLWKIFTIPSLRKRTLIMMFIMMARIFVLYGLLFNIGALAGNVYLNMCIYSIVDVSAVLFSVLAVNRFGRRNLCAAFFFVAGVSAVLTIFPYVYASKDQYWTVTVLAIFSRVCVTGLSAVTHLYTCELYPTCIRNVSVGFLAACGRFGGIMSPYVMNAVVHRG